MRFAFSSWRYQVSPPYGARLPVTTCSSCRNFPSYAHSKQWRSQLPPSANSPFQQCPASRDSGASGESAAGAADASETRPSRANAADLLFIYMSSMPQAENQSDQRSEEHTSE